MHLVIAWGVGQHWVQGTLTLGTVDLVSLFAIQYSLRLFIAIPSFTQAWEVLSAWIATNLDTTEDKSSLNNKDATVSVAGESDAWSDWLEHERYKRRRRPVTENGVGEDRDRVLR